jgi:hypothetical protein
MGPITVSNATKWIDRVMDFIPGASTVNNIVDLVMRRIYCSESERVLPKAFKHIEDKSDGACFLLAIPGFNFPVACYRLWKKHHQETFKAPPPQGGLKERELPPGDPPDLPPLLPLPDSAQEVVPPAYLPIPPPAPLIPKEGGGVFKPQPLSFIGKHIEKKEDEDEEEISPLSNFTTEALIAEIKGFYTQKDFSQIKAYLDELKDRAIKEQSLAKGTVILDAIKNMWEKRDDFRGEHMLICFGRGFLKNFKITFLVSL